MSEIKPISIKTLENLADLEYRKAYYKRVIDYINVELIKFAEFKSKFNFNVTIKTIHVDKFLDVFSGAGYDYKVFTYDGTRNSPDQTNDVNVLVRLFVDLDSPKDYIAKTSNYFPIVTLTKLREINQPAALVETYIKKINMILADHAANKKGDVLSPIKVLKLRLLARL